MGLLCTAPAVAAPDVRLTLEAPAGCPTQAWVARRIDTLLGRQGVRAHSARLAQVRVRAQGSGLEARLALDGGLRVLRTPTQDCAGLLDATALAVVVVLDPLRGLALPAPVAVAEVEPEPVPAEPVREPAPLRVAPLPMEPLPAVPKPLGPMPKSLRPLLEPQPVVVAQTRPLRWQVRGGGVLVAGVTPGAVGYGVQVGAERALGAWSVGLEGRWVPATATPVGAGEVQAGWLGGSALGCRGLVGPLSACAVLSAGAQRAEGSGFARNRAVWLPDLSVGGRARTQWGLGQRGFAFGWAGVGVALARTQLRVAGAVEWQRWPVATALGLGAGLRL